MALKARIDEATSETADTDESSDDRASTAATTADAGRNSPFSMDYDTESYKLDSETADQVLGVMIAVTNLL